MTVDTVAIIVAYVVRRFVVPSQRWDFPKGRLVHAKSANRAKRVLVRQISIRIARVPIVKFEVFEFVTRLRLDAFYPFINETVSEYGKTIFFNYQSQENQPKTRIHGDGFAVKKNTK